MTLRRRWFRVSLLISSLSLSVSGCTVGLKVASRCGNVEILSKELLVEEAESYCQYAVSERKKVEAFWGPTWTETIQIHVDSSYPISMALVPAFQGSRGFMQMPLSLVRDNTGALLHELVHIYAPNRNVFLAEGLAVYLQDKLGGNPGFPNFGRNLNVSARERLSEVRSLSVLNAGQMLTVRDSIAARRTAKTLAGSFVRFLIEEHGLAKFRDLYETKDYANAYGKSLDILEKEWRLSLQENSR